MLAVVSSGWRTGLELLQYVDTGLAIRLASTPLLVVVATIIAASIAMSLRATRGEARRPVATPEGPFKVMDEQGRPLERDGNAQLAWGDQ